MATDEMNIKRVEQVISLFRDLPKIEKWLNENVERRKKDHQEQPTDNTGTLLDLAHDYRGLFKIGLIDMLKMAARYLSEEDEFHPLAMLYTRTTHPDVKGK